MQIFPNPVTDYLNIEVQDFKSKTISYEIINYQGKVVKTGSLEAPGIDVSALNQGVFFLKIIKEDSVIYEEFIKK
ncbi:MAG: T9SS type A sorting domain-containing protein [Flavobacterium sp.]|nr:T9SS type A sorting domain-containing protein [Flavobacterium sp.]